MGRWESFRVSERPDGRLVGRLADADRRFRLSCLVDRLVRAEAERARVQREFDAEVAEAQAQKQHGLVDEAARHLADRRR
jgi:hypothetical protein